MDLIIVIDVYHFPERIIAYSLTKTKSYFSRENRLLFHTLYTLRRLPQLQLNDE